MSLAYVASSHGICPGCSWFERSFRGVFIQLPQVERNFSNFAMRLPFSNTETQQTAMREHSLEKVALSSPDFSPDSEVVNKEQLAGQTESHINTRSVRSSISQTSKILASFFEPLLFPVAVLALYILSNPNHTVKVRSSSSSE